MEREFLQRNNGGDGAVFHSAYALPRKGGEALAHSLRNNDMAADLPCRKSARPGGFPLPAGYAFNAGAHDFRNVRPLIKPEGQHAGSHSVKLPLRSGQNIEQALIFRFRKAVFRIAPKFRKHGRSEEKNQEKQNKRRHIAENKHVQPARQSRNTAFMGGNDAHERTCQKSERQGPQT